MRRRSLIQNHMILNEELVHMNLTSFHMNIPKFKCIGFGCVQSSCHIKFHIGKCI